jgi:hypothetical protein
VAKHAFVDANILLSFYRLSDDTLTELDKLRAAAASGKITLVSNSWAVDEFHRNRERTIKETLNRFQAQKNETGIPRLAEGIKGFEELRKLFAQTTAAKQKLLEEMSRVAGERTLHADKLIDGLLNSAEKLKVTDEILAAARLRMEKGDPPGKEGALGDRIHWECLLKYIPRDEQLALVTADADFHSPLVQGKPRSFLAFEWRRLKGTDLELYSGLSLFVAAHFPDIDVAEIDDRMEAVKQLALSTSFAQTHHAIATLKDFNRFSADEVNEMLFAASENEQIYWIMSDSDVYEFYSSLVKNYRDAADEILLAEIDTLIAKCERPS